MKILPAMTRPEDGANDQHYNSGCNGLLGLLLREVPDLRPQSGPKRTWTTSPLAAGPVMTARERAPRRGRQNFGLLLRGCAPNVYHRTMFIIPYGAPEGYEWFVALVVLVGLYFAVRSFIRSRR